MPLSPRTKSRNFRERQKQKGLHESMKAKDRKRKGEWRKNLSPKKLQELRQTQVVQQRKCHAKKNAKADAADIIVPSTPTSNDKAFQTTQSLGKAVSRAVNSLPRSPTKRGKVMQVLTDKYGIDKENVPIKGNGSSRMPQDMINKVCSFYELDDISWQTPGMKDYVTVRNESGKHKVQKRYMLMTLREAHALYSEQNPDDKIGKSKFAELKPTHITYISDTPHNVCVCKYHENIRLLLLCLHKYLDYLPVSFRAFLECITCNQENEQCMRGNCEDCKGLFATKFEPNEDVCGEETSWYQWGTDSNRSVKMVNNGTVQMVFEELSKQLTAFKLHTFIKRKQSDYFELCKSLVDGEKVVIQIDFAENYAAKEQDEIQSAHWCHKQITIFTAYIWINQKQGQSYAFVSDDLDHGKYAVNAFLEIILTDLKNNYPQVEEVEFFSDGAASQFKQKYLFVNLTFMEDLFKVKASWNFFATSHGKGVIDGIGGNVKRLVWTETLSGKTQVTDAKSFYEVAKIKSVKTKVVYVSSEDIARNKLTLDERWEHVKALPKTHETHSVKAVSKYCVNYAPYSSSDSFGSFCFKEDILSDCSAQECEIESPPVQPIQADISKVKIGDYLLVRYVTVDKNSIRQFVSCVDSFCDVNPNNLFVSFLKKKDTDKKTGKVFMFPHPPRTARIETSQIVQQINGTMGRRQTMCFDEELNAE